ncbi:FkbM family methyltransferase [Aliiroseovarius marinus]|uniref:FkbM family methyltransferase n=1 Tax=Aliiroseovarius marinus TaxID=2500159 RepID=UPI00105B3D50|nr:FkbM family methyltransferase [Aliiroseovarius marinus]
MPQFKLDGLILKIPRKCMNDNIRVAMDRGGYEKNESQALKRHLKPGDRVLDLGGGAGFVALQAARIVGAENVTAVEASADMSKAIGANAVKNGFAEMQVVQGAVVPDGFTDDTVTFEVLPGFWASSISEGGEKTRKASKLVTVPALKFGDLQRRAQPTVISMDIEGAELDLASCAWWPETRIVIMEIHPERYGSHALRQLIKDMFSNGFGWMPWGTRGSVLVFERLDEAPT